jgi:hypothetical protein
MNILTVYPTKNQILHDATGAFMPEAQRFRALRKSKGDSVSEFTYEPKKLTSPDGLFSVIAQGKFDCVAVFSHGIATGLPQLKINRSRAQELAKILTSAAPGGINVILYACLTDAPMEKGLNFASTMAQELHAIGKPFTLFTHRTAGHCCENPNVTIYSGATKLQYPQAAGTLKARYLARMKDTKDTLRFDLPFGMVGI